jgi:hypothetical protein
MKSRALIQGKFDDRLSSARTHTAQLSIAPAARMASTGADQPASEQQSQILFASAAYKPQPLTSRKA